MSEEFTTLEKQLNAASSTRERIDVLNAMAWAVYATKPQHALKYAQEAYELAASGDQEEHPYRLGLIVSMRNQGLAHLRMNNLERAQSLLSDALMLNVETPDPSEHALVFTLLGTIDRLIGNTPVATDRLLMALNKAETANHLIAQGMAHRELALLYIDHSPRDKAMSTLEQSLTIFRQIGYKQGEADALSTGSYIASKLGDYDRARALAEQSQLLYEKLSDNRGQINALIHQGLSYENDPDKALVYFEKAVEKAVAIQSQYLEARALLHIGRVLLSQNKAYNAIDRLQTALVRAEANDSPDLILQVYQALAESYRAIGDYEKALEYFETFYEKETLFLGERARVRMENLYFVHQVEATREETELYRLQSEALEREIARREAVEEELIQSVDQLSILYRVSDEISEIENIQMVLTISLDAAARLSQGEAGFIALVDSETEELKVATFIGDYPPRLRDLAFKPDEGIVGRALVDQEPIRILDVGKDPNYIPLREKTKAMMLVPLLSGWRMVGMLVMETAKPERFTEEVFQFLIVLASRIQVAVDNADLYRQVNKQLNEMRKLYNQVSQLEQVKTDMIRIAAHDLRGPLGIIQGYVQLMQLDVHTLPPQFGEYFEVLERTVKRMKNMLDDILSLEKIEQMASDQNLAELDLETTIQKAFEEYQEPAKAKQQDYTLLNESFGEASILGDQVQLYEAITNIIGNAIKYTPTEGKVTLYLQTDEETVTFKVEDTGYGIPEQMQDKLFQPFFRAKTSETSEIAGTGLGLHLVKKIVERHDGRMIFQSIYGHGSTFGFVLPRRRSDSA